MSLDAEVRSGVVGKLEEREGRMNHGDLEAVGRATAGAGHPPGNRNAVAAACRAPRNPVACRRFGTGRPDDVSALVRAVQEREGT
jgi:hypothetical protein